MKTKEINAQFELDSIPEYIVIEVKSKKRPVYDSIIPSYIMKNTMNNRFDYNENCDSIKKDIN